LLSSSPLISPPFLFPPTKEEKAAAAAAGGALNGGAVDLGAVTTSLVRSPIPALCPAPPFLPYNTKLITAKGHMFYRSNAMKLLKLFSKFD